MNKTIAFTLLMSGVLLTTLQTASADSYRDKIEFASYLEETLGHFWAIEKNLDDKNAELALVHATHPIAELYTLMKPQLKQSDPHLDAQVQDTLMQLQNKATTDVSREQAQKALDDAKGIIEIARTTVVGDDLSNDPLFKAELIKNLLETSVSEYGEAVSDGLIKEMAEFQDGSAFVWKSEQIFTTIQSDIEPSVADKMDEYYNELWNAYDTQADPSEIEAISDEIIHEIDEVLGMETQEDDLLVYVENIKNLLEQTKQAYESGDNDLALSLATKAYLDNFEFLEGPLVEAGHKDLMEEGETMLRIELRDMIKEGRPSSEINSQVDDILKKIDTIATVVPEFGTITMMVLAVSIISIIAITTKSKISLHT